MSTELITTPVEEVMVNTRSRAQEFLLVPQSLTQNGDTSDICYFKDYIKGSDSNIGMFLSLSTCASNN